MLSFDPDWWSETNFGTTLDMGGSGPQGEAMQVAFLAVSDNAMLTDPSGFTVTQTAVVTKAGELPVRMYAMRRPTSTDDIVFAVSSSVALLAHVGTFPTGVYGPIPPDDYTAVPGFPGYTYISHGEIGNIDNGHVDHQIWVPMSTGIVAGGLLAVDGDPSAALVIHDTADISSIVSSSDDNTGDLDIWLGAFAVEALDDPHRIIISDAQASAERWVTVIGGSGGWMVSRVGWPS